MKIVGIDPGKTTGLCLFEDTKFIKGQEAELLIDIYTFLRDSSPDILVIENFSIGSAKVNYRDPIEVIGAVKLYADVNGIKTAFQPASILVNIDKYSKGISVSKHIRSACTHVIHYMIKNLGVSLDAIR